MVKILLSFLGAFLISTCFGRWFIPWLKKRGASQPLNEEVAKIYEETENNS